MEEVIESVGLGFGLRRKAYLVIKRLFDIFVSIISLLILIPLSILVKIAYVLTGDFHSVVFVQKRIGKDDLELWFQMQMKSYSKHYLWILF